MISLLTCLTCRLNGGVPLIHKGFMKVVTERLARSDGLLPKLISYSGPTHSCGRLQRSMRVMIQQEAFVRDFVAVWTKVMNLDRFDVS